MSPHPSADELASFVMGRLTSAEIERIESHLLQCDTCSQHLDHVDQLRDGLLRGLRALGVESSGESCPTNAFAANSLPWCDSTDAAAEQASFGRYQVQAELGRGGMGIVYRAYDPKLKREVALKIIVPHRAVNRELRERFEREAEAAARLRHDNIVQIVDFGEERGCLFCVFELAAGGSLAERLQKGSLAPAHAADLVARLARAVGHAHRNKVIHRDLKPANILFTTEGVPKIADFGLAKLLDDDAGHTLDGALIGSPAYMAPEQATAGAMVGTAADVHALGVILYESVTGTTPYKGDTILGILHQLRDSNPVPLARHRPGLDRDFEAICLKCLEKAPGDRYATPDALADDLERFQKGLPVRAKQHTVASRIKKFVRRRPYFSAALIAACVLASGVYLVLANYDSQLQRTQEVSRESNDKVLRNSYARRLASVHESLHEQRGRAHRSLLDEKLFPVALRDFCWRYLEHQCQELALPQHSPIQFISTHPKHERIAVGDKHGRIYVFDYLSDNAPQLRFAGSGSAATDGAFSLNGDQLAASFRDGSVLVFDVNTELAPRVLQSDSEGAFSVAFCANEPTLAVGCHDGRIVFWNLEDDSRHELQAHEPRVTRVAWNCDASWLASGSHDRHLRIWSRDANSEWNCAHDSEFAEDNHYVSDIRFHPIKPGMLAVGTTAGRATLLTLDAKGAIDTQKDWGSFGGAIAWLSFSVDGDRLAGGSFDGKLLVRDAGGDVTGRLIGNKSPITSVAFTAGNTLIASTEEGHAWNAANPVRAIAAHADAVTSLAFTSDSQSLLSSSADGIVRRWNATTGDKSMEWSTPGEMGVWNLVASSNQAIASNLRYRANHGGEFLSWIKAGKLYRANALSSEVTLLGTIGEADCLALDAAGERLLVANNGNLQALQLKDQTAVWSWNSEPVSRVAASPIAGQFAFVAADRQLWLGNLAQSRPRRAFVSESLMNDIAFLPDGHRIALATVDHGVIICSTTTGSEQCRTSTFGEPISRVAVSPDARTLATADAKGAIRLWDCDIGAERLNFLIGSEVWSLAFSPNGNKLACGDAEGTIHIWSADE